MPVFRALILEHLLRIAILAVQSKTSNFITVTNVVNTSSGNFVESTILKIVQLGGTLADDATFEKRKDVCSTCPHFGKVYVLGIELQGCTICGCPLETKGRTNSFFSLTRGRVIDTTCPHPDGDKWNFKTTKE